MLHVPDYQHELKQRADSFHLFEDVVHCVSNNGADVVGQVGTNWVRCNCSTPDEICTFCERLSDAYETPFHMSGMCLVEGLRALDADKIAVNPVSMSPAGAVSTLPVNGIAVILRSSDKVCLAVGLPQADTANARCLSSRRSKKSRTTRSSG